MVDLCGLGRSAIKLSKVGFFVAQNHPSNIEKLVESIWRTGVGGRTSAQGYGGDDEVRKKFTGYEKDAESGLEFAQARYYNLSHGRFTTVDPIGLSEPNDPQRVNGYVYTWNSPLKYVDRDGRWPTKIHDLIIALAFPSLSKGDIERIQKGNFREDFPTTVLGYYANEHGMCKPGQNFHSCLIGNVSAMIPDMEEGIAAFLTGDLESAYRRLGAATHTPQDALSPAHAFQTYDDYNLLMCLLMGPTGSGVPYCLEYRNEMGQHSEQERYISMSQLNSAVSITRDVARDMFGNAWMKNAIGIFGNARFIFNGPIDGKQLPTVDRGDLGTVTVSADGSEEYEGPLNKLRSRRLSK